MLTRYWERRQNDEGFTLIELLVVVIIIGILAAIAIPTFLNQRRRGWQAELTSNLRNVALEVEAAATANNGSYVGLDDDVTMAGGFAEQIQGAPADPVVFTTVATDFTATAFCMSAQHLLLGVAAGDPIQVYDSAAAGLQDYDDTGADTC